jgi:transcriptional regulator of aromatic amino acid metabolism
MKDALRLLSEASLTDVNVLIAGETGTGKELFAQVTCPPKSVPTLELEYVPSMQPSFRCWGTIVQ